MVEGKVYKGPATGGAGKRATAGARTRAKPGGEAQRLRYGYRPTSAPASAAHAADSTGPAAGVLDVVKIPAHLPAGEYVLGWRYDCEGTAQVWENCADVSLRAA